MTGLQQLDLSFNKKLQSSLASTCAKLTKLKVLSLQYCDIQELPAELSAMTGLELLDLSRNNNLRSLPTSVCTGLTKLKVLNVREYDIQELPLSEFRTECNDWFRATKFVTKQELAVFASISMCKIDEIEILEFMVL